MVNVARSRRSARVGVDLDLGVGGLGLHPARERAPQAAVEHQRLEHVARDVRAADLPDHARAALAGAHQHDVALRAAAAVQRRLACPRARTAARPPGSGRACAARRSSTKRVSGPSRRSVFSAIGRASSRSVSGSSTARTVGRTPFLPMFSPLGRKYSPTVRSSTPPLESGSTSWNTPLPNVRVPTTVARLRVAQGAGHDLGRRGAAAIHQHHHRDVLVDRVALGLELALGLGAALRVGDQAVLDEDRRHQHGLAAAARRRCRAGRARCPSPRAPCTLSISRRRRPWAPLLKVVSSTTP